MALFALALVLSCTSASLSSCRSEPAGGANGPWRGTIEAEDGVTTVINESGTVWDGGSRLVEVATIGTGDSAEYIFDEPGGVATDGEQIYVTDREASVVRVYDMEGRYLEDLGGRGQGPGEMDAPKGIGIAADGRILVQDNGARRIHVFNRDHEYIESWERVWTSSTWDERFTVTPDGRAYILNNMIPTGAGTRPEDYRRAMVPWGPTGHREGVAIDIPVLPLREDSHVGWGAGWSIGGADVPFMPRPHWMMAKDTTLVIGLPDEYRFEIRHPDGSTTVVERAVQPVRVQRGEFDWWKQNIVLWARQRYPSWSWNGPSAPRYKPFFDGLYLDEAGRVWVLRELEGQAVEDCAEGSDDYWERLERPCWQQPRAFEIFSPEGRLLTTAPYFGKISRYFLPLIDGDIVLIPEEDPNGNVFVRHYRWAIPEGVEDGSVRQIGRDQ
jgi:hypothetical protein